MSTKNPTSNLEVDVFRLDAAHPSDWAGLNGGMRVTLAPGDTQRIRFECGRPFVLTELRIIRADGKPLQRRDGDGAFLHVPSYPRVPLVDLSDAPAPMRSLRNSLEGGRHEATLEIQRPDDADGSLELSVQLVAHPWNWCGLPQGSIRPAGQVPKGGQSESGDQVPERGEYPTSTLMREAREAKARARGEVIRSYVTWHPESGLMFLPLEGEVPSLGVVVEVPGLGRARVGSYHHLDEWVMLIPPEAASWDDVPETPSAESLRKAGWVDASDQVQGQVPDRRQGESAKSEGGGAQRANAASWALFLETLPPQRPGTRHQFLATTVAPLGSYLGLDVDQWLPVVQKWNADRNHPPLPEAEVRKLVEEAYANSPVARAPDENPDPVAGYREIQEAVDYLEACQARYWREMTPEQQEEVDPSVVADSLFARLAGLMEDGDEPGEEATVLRMAMEGLGTNLRMRNLLSMVGRALLLEPPTEWEEGYKEKWDAFLVGLRRRLRETPLSMGPAPQDPPKEVGVQYVINTPHFGYSYYRKEPRPPQVDASVHDLPSVGSVRITRVQKLDPVAEGDAPSFQAHIKLTSGLGEPMTEATLDRDPPAGWDPRGRYDDPFDFVVQGGTVAIYNREMDVDGDASHGYLGHVDIEALRRFVRSLDRPTQAHAGPSDIVAHCQHLRDTLEIPALRSLVYELCLTAYGLVPDGRVPKGALDGKLLHPADVLAKRVQRGVMILEGGESALRRLAGLNGLDHLLVPETSTSVEAEPSAVPDRGQTVNEDPEENVGEKVGEEARGREVLSMGHWDGGIPMETITQWRGEPTGLFARGMHEACTFLLEAMRFNADPNSGFPLGETLPDVAAITAEDVRYAWVKIPAEEEGRFGPAAPGDGTLITYVTRTGLRMPGEHVGYEPPA